MGTPAFTDEDEEWLIPSDIFKRDPQIAQKLDALAHAQAIICLIFWSLCGCVYAGLSITYPAERRRIATLGFALAAGGENNGEDIALLVGDDEEDEELQDVVPRI